MSICVKSMLTAFSMVMLMSCANRSYMTPTSIVKPDSLMQINDEDIRNAFNMKPQLSKPLITAIYNAGANKSVLIDSVEKLSGIKNVFEISPWMIEGDEYKQRVENRWFRNYREPGNTPIKAIRLEAAKGKADIVVYCGITHRYQDEGNWLSWTYLGIVPMFFVPGYHSTLKSSIDIFVIDVRNGFSYGNYHDDIVSNRKYVKMNFNNTVAFDKWTKDQEVILISGATKAISRVLNNSDFYIK